MNPPRLAVGEPYPATLPPSVQYNYRAGAHELLMVMDRPTSREIQSVRRGLASFAVVIEQPVIWLLYRFDPGLPWSDAPYTIWRVPEGERIPPEPPEREGAGEPRALLTTILVNADTNIVEVLRVTSLSPALTAALHLAIRAQYDAGPHADYDDLLAEAYQRYPSTEAMLPVALARSDARWK